MTSASGTYANAFALFRAGRIDDAAAACRAALSKTPRSPELLDLAGMIARLKGNHPSALHYFTAAAELVPDAAVVRLHCGLALRSIGGREKDAIGELRRAIALQPTLAEAHHQLGNALKALKQYAAARESLEEAVRLAPQDAAAWLNLGVTQLELRHAIEAVASFRRAVQLEPMRAESHNILGTALQQVGDLAAARAALAEALRLRPEFADAHNNLARVLKAQGRLPEAIEELRAALAHVPSPGTHSNLLYALLFDPGITPETILAEHRDWNRIHAAPLASAIEPHQNLRDPVRRLRVGFVSADFLDHAVAYFFEPVLRARDLANVEITCYSDVAVGDRVTARLRGLADRWRDTATLSHAELASLIRSDAIDILVDLAGHTARNRLPMFARKPAPIQVTWLGYPNSTGLTAIDYRITDAVSDPPGETERWHSETVIRLPTPFLCYRPPDESPDPAAPATDAPVTFSSFSNLPKLSEPCLAAWAEILRRVEGARLVLKSRGLGDVETAARVREVFSGAGVAPERIELIGALAPVAEHLALYHRIDIALDPFPYNGTTSTCEALWMGMPVVTLAGVTHVQRVGSSLMTAIGATEWIACSVDDYVDRAVGLAHAAPELRRRRAEFRDRVKRSPLCDARGFRDKWELALREMWKRYCEQG